MVLRLCCHTVGRNERENAMHVLNKVLITTAALVFSALSSAGTAVLTFEGMLDQEDVLDYYNGGTSSGVFDPASNTTGGAGSGTNYGISFGVGGTVTVDSDVAPIDPIFPNNGNIANAPSGAGVLFFYNAPDAVMNVAAGFTALSFYYSLSGAGGFVNIWDGLNATGNLLGTLYLQENFDGNACAGDPTGSFCNWTLLAVPFTGVAMSADFTGLAASFVAFDNMAVTIPTFGVVAEPGSLALWAVALGALAAARRKRQIKS